MILSGYELMVKTFASQRPSLKNVWSDVFPFNEPVSKSLIEIVGAQGTGKSILLQEIMARALLKEPCGKSCQVIFLDLSHKFELSAFTELLQNVKKSIIGSHQVVENPLAECCESLICLECYSAEQFEFAFDEIEDLLWDFKRVSLVAIDSLNTFYWDECSSQLQRMSTHYKNLVQRLKSLCQQHNISCAYTVDENYLALKHNASDYFPYSLIDYKFKLKEKDGRNYLNDSLIKLSYDGIEFLKNQ